MTPSSTENPLALLPLPSLADLSEEQVRGTACVWCVEPISTATAVDLGERRVRILDGAISMFPRACGPCVGVQAEQAAAEHAGSCEQCVDDASSSDADVCDTARALRRIVLERSR